MQPPLPRPRLPAAATRSASRAPRVRVAAARPQPDNQRALHKAVRLGDAAKTLELIQLGVGVDYQTSNVSARARSRLPAAAAFASSPPRPSRADPRSNLVGLSERAPAPPPLRLAQSLSFFSPFDSFLARARDAPLL